jgi:hypothetical protein
LLALHGSGAEGADIAAYLARTNPRVWLNPFFIRPGGGMALTVPILGRWLFLSIRDQELPLQAGLLAHEAMHLIQGDRFGRGTTSQADEVEAYQVQGRILRLLGRGGGFAWSEDVVQRYAPSQPEALSLLRRTWPLYAAWPVARPHGPLHTAAANFRQTVGALGYAIAMWRAARSRTRETNRR